jgi:ABC-type xylose transport system permease subunit
MTSFSLLLTRILTLLIKILALLQNFNISYRNIDITHRNIDITHRNNDSNLIFTVGVVFALLTGEINQVINIYWLFYLYLVIPLIFSLVQIKHPKTYSVFLNLILGGTALLRVQHPTFQVTKTEFKIIIGRYCFVDNILIYITNFTHRIIMVPFLNHFKEL